MQRIFFKVIVMIQKYLIPFFVAPCLFKKTQSCLSAPATLWPPSVKDIYLTNNGCGEKGDVVYDSKYRQDQSWTMIKPSKVCKQSTPIHFLHWPMDPDFVIQVPEADPTITYEGPCKNVDFSYGCGVDQSHLTWGSSPDWSLTINISVDAKPIQTWDLLVNGYGSSTTRTYTLKLHVEEVEPYPITKCDIFDETVDRHPKEITSQPLKTFVEDWPSCAKPLCQLSSCSGMRTDGGTRTREYIKTLRFGFCDGTDIFINTYTNPVHCIDETFTESEIVAITSYSYADSDGSADITQLKFTLKSSVDGTTTKTVTLGVAYSVPSNFKESVQQVLQGPLARIRYSYLSSGQANDVLRSIQFVSCKSCCREQKPLITTILGQSTRQNSFVTDPNVYSFPQSVFQTNFPVCNYKDLAIKGFYYPYGFFQVFKPIQTIRSDDDTHIKFQVQFAPDETIPVDVYSTEISLVFYSDDPDPANWVLWTLNKDPLKAIDQTVKMTVTTTCDVEQYNKNSACIIESTYAQVAGEGTDSYDFCFVHSPDCSYIEEYVLTITPQPANADLIKLDKTSSPPKFVVESYSGDEGNYFIQISAFLNTIPITFSDESINFTLVISMNECSKIKFTMQTIPRLTFTIAKNAAPTQVYFNDFPQTPDTSCGLQTYSLFQKFSTDASITLSYRAISFQTTNIDFLGTHTENVMKVELEDYPGLASTVNLFVPFTIVVRSACETTNLIFSSPTITQFVGGVAVEQTEKVTDSYSQSVYEVGDEPFCGQILVKIDRVEWDQAGSVPDIVTLIGDTFSVFGTSNSHFGEYEIFFTASLQNYPTFVPVTLSFIAQVQPDCVKSAITSNEIAFNIAPIGSVQTLQLSISHTLSGVYGGFCDPLVLSLDLDVPYLTLDQTSQILILKPSVDSVPPAVVGVYSHTLRASLLNFSIELPLVKAFTVSITDCAVSSFYACNPSNCATERVDFVTHVAYLLGEASLTLNFLFDDFEMISGEAGCQSQYQTVFSSSLSATWLTNFDPKSTFFNIQSDNPDDVGYFRFEVSASINTYNSLVSSTKAVFEIQIKSNPCVLATLDPFTIENLFVDLLVSKWASTQVTLKLNLPSEGLDCGPFQFSLTGPAANSWVLFDPDTKTVLALPSLTNIDTFYLQLDVQLAQFPNLFAAKGSAKFTVKVSVDCSQTKLLVHNIDSHKIFHMPDNLSFTTIGVRDSISNQLDDGFSVCGPRIYTISPDSLYLTQTTETLLTVNCNQDRFDDTLWYPYTKVMDIVDLQKNLPNLNQTATLTVSLQNYPLISSSIKFNFSVFPSCEKNVPSYNDYVYEYFKSRYLTDKIYLAAGKTYNLQKEFFLSKISYYDILQLNYLNLTNSQTDCGRIVHVYGSNVGEKFEKTLRHYMSQTADNLRFSPGESDVTKTEDDQFSIKTYFRDYPTAEANHTVNVKIFSPQNTTTTFADKESSYIFIDCSKAYCGEAFIPGCSNNFDFSIQSDSNLAFQISLSEDLCDGCLKFLEPKWTGTPSFIKASIQVCVDKELVGKTVVVTIFSTDVKGKFASKDVTVRFVKEGEKEKTEADLEKAYKEQFIPNTTLDIPEEVKKPNSTNTNKTEEKVLAILTKFAWLLRQSDFNPEDNFEILQALAEIPAPVPFLQVSNDGQVGIWFSRAIQIPIPSELLAYVQDIMEKEALVLSILDQETNNLVRGKPVFNQTLFLLNQPDAASKKNNTRLLQSDTNQSDSSLKSQSEKQFNWTVISVTNRKIKIQLNVDRPAKISWQTGMPDQVVVEFSQLKDFFKDALTSESLSELPQQQKYLPKFLSEAVAALISATVGSSAVYAQLVALGQMALSMGAQFSMQNLWGSIHALAITVHVPIFNVSFPPNANDALQKLIGVMTFDIVQIQDLFPSNMQIGLKVTETDAFNERFEGLNYGSSNTVDNLGSVNIIIVVFLVNSVLLLISRLRVFERYRYLRRFRARFSLVGTVNSWLRLLLEMYFGTIIVCLVTVLPADRTGLLDMEQWVVGDRFTIVYTYILFAVFALFLVLAGWATLCLLPAYARKVAKHQLKSNLTQLVQALQGAKELQSDAKFQKETYPYTVDVHLEFMTRQNLTAFEKLKLYASNNTLTEQVASRIEALKTEKQLLPETGVETEDQDPIKMDTKIEMMAVFLDGLNTSNSVATSYYFLYLIRRTGLLMSFFWLDSFPGMQVSLFILLATIQICFNLVVVPFETRFTNNLELFNELSVYIAGIHTLSLLQNFEDPEICYDIGSSLIAFLCLNLFVNMVIVSKAAFNELKTRCKKSQAKCLATFDRLIPKETCSCKCAICGPQVKEKPFAPVEFSIQLKQTQILTDELMIDTMLRPDDTNDVTTFERQAWDSKAQPAKQRRFKETLPWDEDFRPSKQDLWRQRDKEERMLLGDLFRSVETESQLRKRNIF